MANRAAETMTQLGQRTASEMGEIVRSGSRRQSQILREIADARARGDIAKAQMLSQMVQQVGQVPQEVRGFQDVMRKRKMEERGMQLQEDQLKAQAERQAFLADQAKQQAVVDRMAVVKDDAGYKRAVNELGVTGILPRDAVEMALATPWTPELGEEFRALKYGPPTAKEGFTLTPGGKRYDASGKLIADAAPTPEKPEKPTSQIVMGIKDGKRKPYKITFDDNGEPIIPAGVELEQKPEVEMTPYQKEQLRLGQERLDLSKSRPPQGAQGSWTPLMQDGKLVYFNPTTGEQRASPEGARPASGAAGKPPTAAELRAFNFFMRADDAVKQLDELESVIAEKGLIGQTRLKYAPNFLQTQEGQLYEQAQRQFTEARLRKDSGAAIPPHEYDNDKRTYFSQPGDTSVTLERKRKARSKLREALKVESGRAYQESFEEEGSQGRGARSGGAPPGTGKIKLPSGIEITY